MLKWWVSCRLKVLLKMAWYTPLIGLVDDLPGWRVYVEECCIVLRVYELDMDSAFDRIIGRLFFSQTAGSGLQVGPYTGLCNE